MEAEISPLGHNILVCFSTYFRSFSTFLSFSIIRYCSDPITSEKSDHLCRSIPNFDSIFHLIWPHEIDNRHGTVLVLKLQELHVQDIFWKITRDFGENTLNDMNGLTIWLHIISLECISFIFANCPSIVHRGHCISQVPGCYPHNTFRGTNYDFSIFCHRQTDRKRRIGL